MFLIEQKEIQPEESISSNAFILVFIFTTLFSICLLLLRYVFKRQTERRNSTGATERVRVFNMNRLNSEQFDIAATLTVEELRDHRKIRREKRDQEIERMERILVNQGQKINVYEKQIIERSLTLLKTEKMEDLNNFMKLLIEAKYNIKIDAFNQKDCVICFDTFD